MLICQEVGRADHSAHGKIERVNIRQTYKRLLHPWLRLSILQRIILGVAVFSVVAYIYTFAVPKQVTFAYSGQDCVRQLTFFPGFMKQVAPSGYSISFEDDKVINGVSVVSLKTCFTAVNVPSPGKTNVVVSPGGSWFAAKHFSLNVSEAPVATTTDFIGKTLPVTRPVEISLSGPDEVFDYKFEVGGKVADCEHEESTIRCGIDTLDLIQGETFDASLIRYFDGKLDSTLAKGQIKTLKALTLVAGTLSGGQTVYDKPASFSFEYDKEIKAAEAELKIKNGEVFETIAATISTDGKKVIVAPKNELARNSEFQLTLKSVEGVDGSSLADPYVLGFLTAGGPKVTGININSTGVATAGKIIVTFDQDVANFDTIAKNVVVTGLNSQVTGSGKQLTITYDGGTCVDFSIVVKKGFENASKIVQTDDWRFTARTLCYTVQSIGLSRQGRAINAFSFGSGSKTILFTGAIHGNEQSSRLLMNAWINELDFNVRSIPAGTRIVVVPSINPDGIAANNRYNAAGIDLNRNYDVSDWKTDIETVNGTPYPGGGGPAPGSEPETQALMAFTTQLRPALTMSYHSSASYAIGNTCGNSASLAATYADLTGYSNMTGVSGAFSYQITGTYDDWICEKLGLASVLIELSTSSNSEFSRNKAALWAMAKS